MERKNRITYKIKTGYYLDLLTRETNKLPGSTKIKVVKDENGKNAPDLLSVKSVRIRSYSGPYLIWMLKSTDQSNSEYGHFSRRVGKYSDTVTNAHDKEKSKERHISLEERQKIIDDLRLR